MPQPAPPCLSVLWETRSRRRGRRQAAKERAWNRDGRWWLSELRWDSISIIEFVLRPLPLLSGSFAVSLCFHRDGLNWGLTHLVPLQACTNNMMWHQKVSWTLGNAEKDVSGFLKITAVVLSQMVFAVSQNNKNQGCAVPVKVTYPLWKSCHPAFHITLLPDSSSHCWSITFSPLFLCQNVLLHSQTTNLLFKWLFTVLDWTVRSYLKWHHSDKKCVLKWQNWPFLI